MGIAILKSGKVIVVLKGATVAEMADHILNGYPQFISDLPVLIAEEHPDDALPPVAPPVVVPPTPEELAAAEAKEQYDAINRKIFLVAFNYENRIRVLEGKSVITKAQFKTALEAI